MFKVGDEIRSHGGRNYIVYGTRTTDFGYSEVRINAFGRAGWYDVGHFIKESQPKKIYGDKPDWY